jgi:hypothetical protein
MPRKIAKEYPPFHRSNFWLVLISGESPDSGRSSGLNAEAKLGIISANYERI